MSFDAVLGHLRNGGQLPPGVIQQARALAAQGQARAAAELRKSLRKSATAGYQTPTGISGGDTGTFSPLILQSIQDEATNLSYSSKQLSLMKYLKTEHVNQTVHEVSNMQSQGDDLGVFFNEGGVAQNTTPVLGRESYRVKYMGVTRQITDVAGLIGIQGIQGMTQVSTSALQFERAAGLQLLMKKTEQEAWFAKSSDSVRKFDGIFTQMKAKAPENHTDLQGDDISFDRLEQQLYDTSRPENYGLITHIHVEPMVHQSLSRQMTKNGRSNVTTITGSTVATHGFRGLEVMGPAGPVPIVSATWLKTDVKPAANAAGVTAMAIPSLSVAAAVAADAASKFTGAFGRGIYKYYIVAHGKDGSRSAPFAITAPVLAAKGEKVTFTIADNGSGNVEYYKIYRTAKGASVSTAVYIDSTPFVALGTAYADLNLSVPGSSKVFMANWDKRDISWLSLLDTIQRPLPTLDTTTRFMLMHFGTPAVKAAQHMWVLENVIPSKTAS